MTARTVCGNAETASKVVERILKSRDGGRLSLIAILQDIQAELGYLPEDALRAVSKGTGRSLIDIYGVASFYHSFRFKPKGKHLLSVCLGTACHVRGGAHVAEELCKKLGVEPGETSSDGEFTLETVNCLGCCAIGPVVVKDGQYHGQVSIKDVEPLIGGHKSKRRG
ncbi:MAG: NAD(P)H-dependent oxidoreductase subunit E [Elusimicrobiota bacterium]